MYNIIQLNDEKICLKLQQICPKEIWVCKKGRFTEKRELVYRILDEQAIVGATKKKWPHSKTTKNARKDSHVSARASV